jgi:hypothetical protein
VAIDIPSLAPDRSEHLKLATTRIERFDNVVKFNRGVQSSSISFFDVTSLLKSRVEPGVDGHGPIMFGLALAFVVSGCGH